MHLSLEAEQRVPNRDEWSISKDPNPDGWDKALMMMLVDCGDDNGKETII